MKTYFSKPSQDIALESLTQMEQDRETIERQRRLSALLLNAVPRSKCLLCADILSKEIEFLHRGIQFVHCINCGHVQSVMLPPEGYPHDVDGGATFDAIYPKLERSAYVSRRERIYQPKLEWVLIHLEENGIEREQALAMNWLELGSGAGYFLDALKTAGANNFAGLERVDALCAIANEALGKNCVDLHQGLLGDGVRTNKADVIVAFFVLEHLSNGDNFWAAMSVKPKGTMFIFAVPVFSLATLLESAFENYAARNLDGVVHTQLYTDKSIAYALDRAGYETQAEWVFGQDATDFVRAILVNTKEKFSAPLFDEISEQLSLLIDPLQSVIDHSHLADARHILAIKRY